jgi:DNA replication protein DnaC
MERLGEILQDLQKTIQEKLQKDSLPKADEDLSKYECAICKDQGFIFYRIHSDVPLKDLDKDTGRPKDPSLLITEEDFFGGMISPGDAHKWQTKHSERCSCVGKRIRQKRVDQIMAAANLSPRFKKRTFDSIYWLDPEEFEREDQPEVERLMSYQRKAYDVTLGYCIDFEHHSDRGEGFGLLGDVGTAKTHLLAAATNYLIQRGIQAVHVNTAELFEEIRSTYELDEHGKPHKKIKASEILSMIKKCEYLSLDDLGTEKPTEWVKEKFYEILNYRYENELSSSFSSNNTLEELQEHLGKSYRRLIEPCMGRMVQIKGTSFDQLLIRKRQ